MNDEWCYDDETHNPQESTKSDIILMKIIACCRDSKSFCKTLTCFSYYTKWQ